MNRLGNLVAPETTMNGMLSGAAGRLSAAHPGLEVHLMPTLTRAPSASAGC